MMMVYMMDDDDGGGDDDDDDNDNGVGGVWQHQMVQDKEWNKSWSVYVVNRQ